MIPVVNWPAGVSRLSASTVESGFPVGQSAAVLVGEFVGFWSISVASTISFTSAQSAAVIPSVPIRLVHAWRSALARSA